MTEEEAKTKWCPMIHVTIGPQSATWQGAAVDNRFELNGKPTCIGSGCMAWRWQRTANDNPDFGGSGYCGLAGKP